MRELLLIGLFTIAMTLVLLKKNENHWSSTDQWILILSVWCQFFILVYLYTKNITTTKPIIKTVMIYQAVFAMIVLDIVTGMFDLWKIINP